MAAPTPPVKLPPGFLSQLHAAIPARAQAMFGAGAGYHGGPTPRPAPPPKRKSQSVSDVANQQADQQLNPVLASQDAQAKYQNQAIQSFALALLGKLAPTADQVGTDYNQAIGQTAAVSGAAADALRNANPNQQDQQMLAAVNAPDAQRAQIASHLADTYGGGAAVTMFNQGQIPVTELATDKAAAQAQARQLPGIAALKGQQDLSSALYSQRQERERTLAQRPGLVQQATQTIKSNIANRDAAAYDKYKFQTARADALEAAGQKEQAQRIRDKAALDYKYAALTSQEQRAAATVRAENQRSAATIKAENARAAASQTGQNTREQARIDAADRRAAEKASQQAEKAGVFGDMTKGQVQHLRAGMNSLRFGVPKGPPTTAYPKGSPAHPPLSYQQAIQHAVGEGYSRRDATEMANRFYPPGFNGRPAKPTPDRGFRDAKLK